MLAAVPGLDEVAQVNRLQVGDMGSGACTFAELYDLSLAVDDA